MPKDPQAAAGLELRRLKRTLKTWKAVTAHLNERRPPHLKPVNIGLVYNVAVKGKRAPNSILACLGLEVQTAPAPVCPIHGVVHLGTCPRPRQRRPPASLFEWPARELARAIRDRSSYHPTQGDQP